MKKIFFILLLITIALGQFTNDKAGWYAGAYYVPDGTVYAEGVTVVDEGTLAAESLNETDFATHAKWDVTNDFDDSGGNAAFVWSANQTSTLTQIQANLATVGVDAVWYLFTYTVAVTTAFDGDGAVTITTGFASSAVTLDLSVGTHSVYFKSKTTPVDFVISVVSGTDTEGSWTIDDVTLKQITGGNVDIAGILLVRGVDIGAGVVNNNTKNSWDYNADVNKVINVVDPTNPQDAATMLFVENAVGFTFDYFFGNTSDAEAGIYYVVTDDDLGGGESNIDANIGSSGDDKPLANFLTIDGEPGIQQLESGIYEVHIHAQKVSGSSLVDGIYWELYKRASVGTGGAEILLATSEISGAVTTALGYNIHLSLTSPITILNTDRLLVKFYANLTGGSGAIVRLIQEGITASHFEFQTTSNILSNIFMRQDGTTPMAAALDMGAFEITNVGNVDGVDVGTDVPANTNKVGVTTELKNVVEDITPQLGANLDIQAFNVTGTGYWQAGVHAFGKGGTGLSTWTQYLIPYAATTTSIGQIPIGTNGQVLTSAGAGVAPSFEDVAAGGDFSDGGEVGGAARTLGNTDGYNMGFKTNNVERFYFGATTGHFTPVIPNTYDIGNSTNDLRGVYADYFYPEISIQKKGDPDTYIDFSTADNFKMYVGGVKFFEFTEGGTDFYSFGEGLDIDWYTAWMSFNYGTGLVTVTKATTFDEDITAAKFLKHSVTAGITATNPGVQGDSPLTKEVNEVSVVGATDDAVTLISAVAGYEIIVINNGANTLEIFPASGDNLGAGLNTATSLVSGANITFVAYDDTNWETL